MSLCEECVKYGEHGDRGLNKCPHFKSDKEQPYFNKKDHAQRSLVHQPQHVVFWKKFTKKQKPDIVK